MGKAERTRLPRRIPTESAREIGVSRLEKGNERKMRKAAIALVVLVVVGAAAVGGLLLLHRPRPHQRRFAAQPQIVHRVGRRLASEEIRAGREEIAPLWEWAKANLFPLLAGKLRRQMSEPPQDMAEVKVAELSAAQKALVRKFVLEMVRRPKAFEAATAGELVDGKITGYWALGKDGGAPLGVWMQLRFSSPAGEGLSAGLRYGPQSAIPALVVGWGRDAEGLMLNVIVDWAAPGHGRASR